MRLLIFSDLHVHRWPYGASIGPDGGHDRLMDTLKVLEFVAEVARRERVDGVVFAGDLFHRSKEDAEVLGGVSDRLRAIRPEPFLIAGNHDQLARAGNRQFDLVRPIWGGIDLARKGIAGKDYCDDPKADWDWRPPPDVFVCHQGVLGAQINADFHSPFEHDLDLDSIRKAARRLVIAGHFHVPQLYESDEAGTPTVLIPGAPIQHTWGDAGQSRGIWIADLAPKDIACEFLAYDAAPKFQEVLLDGKSWTTELVRGNFIRFRGRASAVEAAKDRIEEARGLARSVEILIEPEPARAPETRLEGEPEGIEAAIRAYAGQFCGDLPADELAKIGLEILREAEK